ncbi:MAG: hypothetical protein AAF631_05870 [Pseudomonadota bacterium]
MTDLSDTPTLAQAKEAHGQPLSERSFTLTGRDLTEFRIELLNHLDRTEIDAGKVQLTEATWQPSPGKRRTIWFHAGDGSYLHHLDWDEGDEF